MQKQEERSFNRLMVGALVAGFTLLIVAFALIALGLRNQANSADAVQHTYEVKDTLSEFTIAIERSEAARRGFLIAASDYRLRTFRTWIVQIRPQLDRLEQLVGTESDQLARIAQLRPIVDDEIAVLDRSMTLLLSGQREQARADFLRVSTLENLQRIRQISREISDDEERLLAERTAAANRTLRLVEVLLVVTALMLSAVSGFTFWLVRRFTRDLVASRKRLHRLNTDLEGAVAERTVDLQRANDEIQRFAYIVSHDLRSPLVNVMGFTAEMERADRLVADFVERVDKSHPELVSEDVRLAAREDLPEAIGFIRSSTQKMDRLINAILSLSRQGRRVLSPEALAMNPLVEGIADSLTVQAADRGAVFEIASDLPDIHQDRLAVEQIFSNLMENATKYLQPGRPGVIKVSGMRQGARAIFEVADNGRGIAPEDHQRVFDLFRRAGKQDEAGEGIGLANVRALAYRLGGTVTLRSTLGEGSTFIVDLPAVFAAEGKDSE